MLPLQFPKPIATVFYLEDEGSSSTNQIFFFGVSKSKQFWEPLSNEAAKHPFFLYATSADIISGTT